MPSPQKLRPKRQRPIKAEVTVPEKLKLQFSEMELQDLLRQAQEQIKYQHQRVLSTREMYLEESILNLSEFHGRGAFRVVVGNVIDAPSVSGKTPKILTLNQ